MNVEKLHIYTKPSINHGNCERKKEKISKLGKQVKQTENWMLVKWPQRPIWWRQNNCNFANGTDWGIKFFTRELFQTQHPNQTKTNADKMVTEASRDRKWRSFVVKTQRSEPNSGVGKSKLRLFVVWTNAHQHRHQQCIWNFFCANQTFVAFSFTVKTKHLWLHQWLLHWQMSNTFTCVVAE